MQLQQEQELWRDCEAVDDAAAHSKTDAGKVGGKKKKKKRRGGTCLSMQKYEWDSLSASSVYISPARAWMDISNGNERDPQHLLLIYTPSIARATTTTTSSYIIIMIQVSKFECLYTRDKVDSEEELKCAIQSLTSAERSKHISIKVLTLFDLAARPHSTANLTCFPAPYKSITLYKNNLFCWCRGKQ